MEQQGPIFAEAGFEESKLSLLKVLLNSQSLGLKKKTSLTNILHRQTTFKTEQSYKQMQVLYIHTH